MLRTLFNFFRRPPIRMGRVDNRIIRRTVIRNAQFVSFLSSNGSASRRQPDRQDIRLRRQKISRTAVRVALAAGFTWIVIESAQAFSIF